MRKLLTLCVTFCLASTAALAGIPADLALTQVAIGGGSIIAIRHAGDGSGRLFIVDRFGPVRIKPAGSGTLLPTPYLNLSNNNPPFGPLNLGGEGGFLGIAFHPNYESNRQVYVHYTDTNGDAVVVRYLASMGNPNVVDAATAQVVIRIDQDTGFHKGGDIHFGPDNFLYVALGDGAGGNGPDGCNRARTLRPAQLPANDGNHPDCPADAAFTGSGGNPNSRALMGKILRLNVDATTPAGSNELCSANANGSANYAIPATNPFAGTAGTAGNCDEIWAWGLRNPFRFSFDRANGDLYIGDVGEGTVEEIDRQPAGSVAAIDYGWDLCEGNLGTCPTSTPPILTYTHAGGNCAVTGGYRYRGDIADFVGTYVFADYCSGEIRFGTENAGNWSASVWLNGADIEYATFGEDEAGELYLGEINGGRVLRFTSAATGVIFGNGFESP